MCFVGIDLSSWYNTKTKIAVIEYAGGFLYFSQIISEIELYDNVSSNDFANENIISYEEKNKILIEKVLSLNPQVIAIDAPLSLPARLVGQDEQYWEDSDNITSELKNQYIYDNSARFVYSKTKLKPLAPASDLIGKLTARMTQIQHTYPNLNYVKSATFDTTKQQIIEVYPRATLELLAHHIPPYKKNTKFKDEIFKIYTKDMLEIIAKLLSEEFVQTIPNINNDDEFDALICAISGYLVYKNGFVNPPNSDCFTNSFIFLPNI